MQHWHLIHTKIRQEALALDNLERQGFTCFLPMLSIEKPLRGRMQVVQEPLFPRYLFILLDHGREAKSWGPIRSTLGVHRLVMFGQTPAVVGDALIVDIRNRTTDGVTLRHFNTGDSVVITAGPFVGHEAVFNSIDGQGRVMVLLHILSQAVRVKLGANEVRKSG